MIFSDFQVGTTETYDTFHLTKLQFSQSLQFCKFLQGFNVLKFWWRLGLNKFIVESIIHENIVTITSNWIGQQALPIIRVHSD